MPKRSSESLPIVLVPGLNCSARLYAEQIPVLWPFGPVTIADHTRGDSMSSHRCRYPCRRAGAFYARRAFYGRLHSARNRAPGGRARSAARTPRYRIAARGAGADGKAHPVDGARQERSLRGSPRAAIPGLRSSPSPQRRTAENHCALDGRGDRTGSLFCASKLPSSAAKMRVPALLPLPVRRLSWSATAMSSHRRFCRRKSRPAFPARAWLSSPTADTCRRWSGRKR